VLDMINPEQKRLIVTGLNYNPLYRVSLNRHNVIGVAQAGRFLLQPHKVGHQVYS